MDQLETSWPLSMNETAEKIFQSSNRARWQKSLSHFVAICSSSYSTYWSESDLSASFPSFSTNFVTGGFGGALEQPARFVIQI